jgi:2-methylcitrate dehydratase PrpD
MTLAPIARAAARYVAETPGRTLPDAVSDAARRCLVDWFGVALAGIDSAPGRMIRDRARAWRSDGAARILLGETAAPAVAAFVNATYAHVHDFDDTHIPTDAHFSGPTWAAVLALGQQCNASADTLLRAFVAGFEAGAKLGGRRLGHAMQARGFHPTGVMGRLSVAASAAAILGLDAERAGHALALAVTQAAGLTGSVGTMSKPLQGGKVAMEGIMAAELAAEGMTGEPAVFESGGGLASAFVQDGFAEIADPDFAAGWEILRNSFKPYACLHGIHPSVDAALALAPRVAGRPIRQIEVEVAPGVARIGGNPDPRTPLEAKFSVAYCVALGLSGRQAMPDDFNDDLLADHDFRALMRQVAVIPVDGRKMINSKITVTCADGCRLEADVPLSRGHPGNPMDWDALEAKFMALAEPVLGSRAGPLCRALREFDRSGAMAEAFALMDGRPAGPGGAFSQRRNGK